MNEIQLRVEESPSAILTVDEEAPIAMDGGEARIIEAISPTATITPVIGGYVITITDLNGTTTATIYQGNAITLRLNDDGTYTMVEVVG